MTTTTRLDWRPASPHMCDQALAEVERLRGNQRVEVVEEWHGLAGRSE